MSTPQWRPELAVEIETHRRIGMRLEGLAPQVAGQLCDLGHYLHAESRMLTYARVILTEAAAAAPYSRTPAQGYAEARERASSTRCLVSDAWPLEVLEARWHDLPAANVTAAVWVVRAFIRIHARRHGRVESLWAEGFSEDHATVVEAMQHTLLGAQPPARRFVRPWRRHHA